MLFLSLENPALDAGFSKAYSEGWQKKTPYVKMKCLADATKPRLGAASSKGLCPHMKNHAF